MYLNAIRAAICAEAKARTKSWADLNGYTQKPVAEDRSEKVKDIEKILADKNFGVRGPSYAALVSVLVGEPVSAIAVKPVEVSWGAGVVVVPLGNGNAHNYVLNEPTINRSGGTVFLRPDGNAGNNMTTIPAELRPATDDEIDTLLKKAVDKFIIEMASAMFSYPYPAK